MQFEFFDPQGEVTITYRRLPHWDQPGVMCFITWRTVDSIPGEVLQRWRAERGAWLRRHEIDPLAADWRERLRHLPVAARRDYHERFTSRWMECLDECHGACVLRRPEFAAVVAESLLHQDGQEYAVSDFVVMPNHVHVLAQFRSQGDMKHCCQNWKHYTARQINQLRAITGHFWQAESFDHLVRSPEQLEYLRGYVARNPAVAGLKAGEYRHFRKYSCQALGRTAAGGAFSTRRGVLPSDALLQR
jgi:REP element-mobilizing transposase RayT